MSAGREVPPPYELYHVNLVNLVNFVSSRSGLNHVNYCTISTIVKNTAKIAKGFYLPPCVTRNRNTNATWVDRCCREFLLIHFISLGGLSKFHHVLERLPVGIGQQKA